VVVQAADESAPIIGNALTCQEKNRNQRNPDPGGEQRIFDRSGAAPVGVKAADSMAKR
jgi:hypothetical protein